MSLVDTREIATAKIVMLGGTGGSNVEGNPTGSATEYLSKIQIDDTIFETAGVIPFDVTLINNSDIHISAVNAGQLDGKTILINTTTHTGTTPAGWFLKINQSTSYEMITPEGRSFKDAMSDNMAMIVRLDASQAEATVLGVLGADSSDVVSGLGIGKKTSVSNNVIITDIDLHRAPMAGDRLLIWFDASVQNPTGLTTYNNGTAVTSNLENVSPLNYNAGWNIVQFMNDGLLYNNVWVRVQNVPLPINTLSGLSDTAIASPSDGQLLTYDNATQKWKNKTYVEANTGFPVTELKKLKVGNIVYDTDGMKNYFVSNVANNNITVSVLNSNQFVQEVIAINTGNHTGSSSAWNLVISDGLNPVSVALKNADGSPFADDIHENELLFVYVDTAGNVARVLEIHSHDLEILKDAIITEKTVSGNPITVTDALPYNAVSLSAEIKASQDLHGYDHPWVGGAYKNKFNIGNALSGYFATTNNGLQIHTDGDIGAKVTAKITESNGSINVSNYDTAGFWWMSKELSLEKNTDYIISGTTISGSMGKIVGFNGDLTEGATGTEIRGGYGTFNTGSYDHIIISFYPSNLNLSNLMIRLATVADATFAPYSNICPISGRTSVTITDYDSESNTATATIQLGQTVYGGTLNVTTGVLTITHVIKDLGDLEWAKDGDNRYYYRFAADENMKTWTGDNVGTQISSIYEAISNTQYSQRYKGGINITLSSSRPSFMIYDPTYNDTAANFGTYVDGQTVCYELATPQTIQLSPTELQMLKGYNRLSCDGGGDITLTYKADRIKALEDALAQLGA